MDITNNFAMKNGFGRSVTPVTDKTNVGRDEEWRRQKHQKINAAWFHWMGPWGISARDKKVSLTLQGGFNIIKMSIYERFFENDTLDYLEEEVLSQINKGDFIISYFNDPTILSEIQKMLIRAMYSYDTYGYCAYWTVKNVSQWIEGDKEKVPIPFGVLQIGTDIERGSFYIQYDKDMCENKIMYKIDTDDRYINKTFSAYTWPEKQPTTLTINSPFIEIYKMLKFNRFAIKNLKNADRDLSSSFLIKTEGLQPEVNILNKPPEQIYTESYERIRNAVEEKEEMMMENYKKDEKIYKETMRLTNDLADEVRDKLRGYGCYGYKFDESDIKATPLWRKYILLPPGHDIKTPFKPSTIIDISAFHKETRRAICTALGIPEAYIESGNSSTGKIQIQNRMVVKNVADTIKKTRGILSSFFSHIWEETFSGYDQKQITELISDIIKKLETKIEENIAEIVELQSKSIKNELSFDTDTIVFENQNSKQEDITHHASRYKDGTFYDDKEKTDHNHQIRLKENRIKKIRDKILEMSDFISQEKSKHYKIVIKWKEDSEENILHGFIEESSDDESKDYGKNDRKVRDDDNNNKMKGIDDDQLGTKSTKKKKRNNKYKGKKRKKTTDDTETKRSKKRNKTKK